MRRECLPRYRGLAIPTCITARAWRTCRDACRDRLLAVSFEIGGGENIPGIPGACNPRFCVSGKRPMDLTHLPCIDVRHFADNIFLCIFLSAKFRIWIQISLKLVRSGAIDNKPALFQVMAWRRAGDKPLSEPMLTLFTDAYMRHQGRWVKAWRHMISEVVCNCNSGSTWCDFNHVCEEIISVKCISVIVVLNVFILFYVRDSNHVCEKIISDECISMQSCSVAVLRTISTSGQRQIDLFHNNFSPSG